MSGLVPAGTGQWLAQPSATGFWRLAPPPLATVRNAAAGPPLAPPYGPRRLSSLLQMGALVMWTVAWVSILDYMVFL